MVSIFAPRSCTPLSLLVRLLTCSEFHKGELLLVVDVDIDHTRSYTKVQRSIISLNHE